MPDLLAVAGGLKGSPPQGSAVRDARSSIGHDGAMDDDLGLPPGAFARLDEEDDEAFYEPARLVVHIDDGAIAALTGCYREVLPKGGVVLLDLMSSWVSHLP